MKKSQDATTAQLAELVDRCADTKEIVNHLRDIASKVHPTQSYWLKEAALSLEGMYSAIRHAAGRVSEST
jgi:hypothetical protein